MAIFEKVFGDNFLAKVAQIFHNLNNITDVATLKGTFEVFLATLEFLTTGRAGRDKRTNKKAKTLIFIGIDGAEGEVLGGGQLRLGEDVEEGRLADVGQADDAALQVGAHAAQDDGLLFGDVLLGRHLDWWLAGS